MHRLYAKPNDLSRLWIFISGAHNHGFEDVHLGRKNKQFEFITLNLFVISMAMILACMSIRNRPGSKLIKLKDK